MKAIIFLLIFIGTVIPFRKENVSENKEFFQTFSDTIKDIDGNIYHGVIIGNENSSQVWMVENLKSIRFQNGDPLDNVTEGTVWSNLATAAYCDYGNKPTRPDIYGKLYNWHAASDPRNICPAGWHVPSTDEWFKLTSILGESEGGNKIKESGTTHWHSPNSNATNETGFYALPAGYRYEDASFGEQGFCCYFWSSSELSTTNAWTRKLSNHESSIKTCCEDKRCGFSIRCIKNQQVMKL